jgi:3-oxoacyl-[acyl-carrier-protein] synthase-3
MKSCLDKSGIAIDDVKNSYSSTNEKMDEAIIQRFYKLHDRPVPQDHADEHS